MQVVDLTQESDEEMSFGGGVGVSPPPIRNDSVGTGTNNGGNIGHTASRGPPPPLIRFRLPCRFQTPPIDGAGAGGDNGTTASQAPISYIHQPAPCIHTHPPPNPWTPIPPPPPPPPPPAHLPYATTPPLG